MAIHVALNHKTTYRYDRRVQLGPQIVRLRPAPHCRTQVLSYSLQVRPESHFINWQQDPQSNYLARLVFNEETALFEVEVDLVAEMAVMNPFDYFLEPKANTFPFAYDDWLMSELRPYLRTEPQGPRFREYLAGISRKEKQTTDFLVDLNRQLEQDLGYVIRMEPGIQTPEETLERGKGSCRDSAWLLVQLLRHLGLAARFVSGYLIQLKPDVKSLDGPSGAASDFTDLHAWTEVYLPGAGWIGFDPTSGLLASEGHLPLACTPEPSSAAPITGGVSKSEVVFGHEMSVTRIHEDPRVTLPYTDEQWKRIESLGHQIDAELEAGDVRLTMGGEPTLVSVDDYDGDEWNTGALGEHKRERAGVLFRRLSEKFGPGGLLHFGQGKWYPGEQLPRWALTCFWRRDGEPLWTRPALVAPDEGGPPRSTGDAQRFVSALAERLGVPADYAIPGYEDAFYYTWRERRLPVNVDPLDAKVKDPLERARLARVFEQGLDHVVGYALPAASVGGLAHEGWKSGKWFVRPERMYLIPGDSPMGLRLPLDSLPWEMPVETPRHSMPDPMAPRAPLPGREHLLQRSGRQQPLDMAPRPQAPAVGEEDPDVVRTALCVEPYQGILTVFMPPLHTLEAYLDLLVQVEETAASLDMPLQVGGYTPPRDPRINEFSVKPDPGVIEVNVHPAHNWDELVNITTTVYEEAHQCRLGTEKFMIDGRHTGTGGGNHILLGGPRPADSPLLRRPDLLRSLVGYWHNHPALSYLFSGAFVGPTCQAPRVDEGRNDMVPELEMAFREVARRGDTPPWFVDRALRDLLVDITGNTHRSEFCIDKLFSPDSAAGRQGLVEMRAFEMPPHARMSLAQQLLVRTLVARFWKAPYTAPLMRWHTELHDRFMLPHFVERDFEDILRELNEAGYPLEPEWFAPHFEFRFPVFGACAQRDVHLELRQAIEPWHVTGEDAAAGGTARYVDSSVERVQVKARGYIDPRYVITCNGYRVPMHPTGAVGECVAGVRFRAWQPPRCLHPHIGVHTPLVFDIVDTWSGRSLGGCTYHVSHPGGRNYDTRPVNAYEAEARRASRFFAAGHTPGPLTPRPGHTHPEYPFTLDLRWHGAEPPSDCLV